MLHRPGYKPSGFPVHTMRVESKTRTRKSGISDPHALTALKQTTPQQKIPKEDQIARRNKLAQHLYAEARWDLSQGRSTSPAGPSPTPSDWVEGDDSTSDSDLDSPRSPKQLFSDDPQYSPRAGSAFDVRTTPSSLVHPMDDSLTLGSHYKPVVTPLFYKRTVPIDESKAGPIREQQYAKVLPTDDFNFDDRFNARDGAGMDFTKTSIPSVIGGNRPTAILPPSSTRTNAMAQTRPSLTQLQLDVSAVPDWSLVGSNSPAYDSDDSSSIVSTSSPLRMDKIYRHNIVSPVGYDHQIILHKLAVESSAIVARTTARLMAQKDPAFEHPFDLGDSENPKVVLITSIQSLIRETQTLGQSTTLSPHQQKHLKCAENFGKCLARYANGSGTDVAVLTLMRSILAHLDQVLDTHTTETITVSRGQLADSESWTVYDALNNKVTTPLEIKSAPISGQTAMFTVLYGGESKGREPILTPEASPSVSPMPVASPDFIPPPTYARPDGRTVSMTNYVQRIRPLATTLPPVDSHPNSPASSRSSTPPQYPFHEISRGSSDIDSNDDEFPVAPIRPLHVNGQSDVSRNRFTELVVRKFGVESCEAVEGDHSEDLIPVLEAIDRIAVSPTMLPEWVDATNSELEKADTGLRLDSENLRPHLHTNLDKLFYTELKIEDALSIKRDELLKSIRHVTAMVTVVSSTHEILDTAKLTDLSVILGKLDTHMSLPFKDWVSDVLGPTLSEGGDLITIGITKKNFFAAVAAHLVNPSLTEADIVDVLNTQDDSATSTPSNSPTPSRSFFKKVW